MSVDGVKVKKLVKKKYNRKQYNSICLQITKSTKDVFWPVWGRVKNIGRPFLIGIYYSEQKEPENANDFLNDFVNDFLAIKKQGITYINIYNLNCSENKNRKYLSLRFLFLGLKR